MDALASSCSEPHLLTACLKDWDKFGKKNFLLKCKESGLRHALRLLLDLFVKLVCGEGKVDIVSKLLPDLMKHFNDNHSFESNLLDIFWFLDTGVCDTQSEAVKDRYFRLLHLCKSHINSALLMERLSEDTLENLSMIQSKQQFQTRYVRTKTRLFFKQQKFNLMREENEGYAKLITELSQTTGPIEALMTQVRSLIGYFDLDPNRVLDLILDVCEFRVSMNLDFIKLIRLYNPDKLDLTHILGHKFHFTQLHPTDAEIQGARARMLSAAKNYRPLAPSSLAFASSATVNSSLSHSYPNEGPRIEPINGGPPQNPPFSTGLATTPGIHGTPLSGWLSGGPTPTVDDSIVPDSTPSVNAVDTSSFEITDDKDLDDITDSLYENNQKLDLCSALIRCGDWTNAQTILDHFPGYWATGHGPLCKSICDLLHYLIEPLYSRVCPLPSCLQHGRSHPSMKLLSGIHANESDPSGCLTPVTDFNQLCKTVFPLAMYLGPNMSTDVILLVKFCRLGYSFLSAHNTRSGSIDLVYQGFFNLLDEVLLPSLSMVDANCCLAEEVWQLLRFMPYDHRYRLYGQWKHTSCQNEPKIIRKKAQVVVNAKSILKRLSKENIKPMGRQLGKLSHGTPGILFDQVLNTIQLFTNLVGLVVEALKYVSSLGYDVLAFSIIEALTADETKLEDLQLSQSLQALSTFTGLLCKKYQFDLSGLLQYVLNQLKVGKSYDLQVLREILLRMSGIDISEDMTDEQLESMSGGELLLQEGGYYAQIRNIRKNATRLKDALIEHDMIMPFIFLMAQQRDAVLFLDDPDRHVKLVGRLYDQCQGTLVQFITFLSLQLTREEMQTQCIPIERMMGEFHVPADTAFCLHRSLFEQRVARLMETKERSESSKNGDHSKSSPKALFATISQQLCNEIGSAIRPLYPSRVWDELGTNFFVTFWSLQSSDLVVPEAAYQRQVHQLREQIQQIESAPTGWTSARKKRELDRLQGLIEKLMTEQSDRHEHVARVRAWLLAERDSWFQTRSVTKTDTITQFLQLCIYPRVCFTAADAIYAAQFMHVLHQLKTSQFSTLICLDRIFNDITLPTSMCTEDEAHRYGRFLCAVLELVMRWHSSEEIFNQECGQYPGFVTVFRKGFDANTKADQLQYENYRHVVHKWHYRITKSTVACLESGSYSQIRNALIVLTRILPQYPRILQFGSAVERRVHKLREEEKDKRPDLKALAFSYAGLLRTRKDKWVNEDEFHLIENKPIRSDRAPPSANLGVHGGSNPSRGSATAGGFPDHTHTSGLGSENHVGGNSDISQGGSNVRRGIGAPVSITPKNMPEANDPRNRQHVSSGQSLTPVSTGETSFRSHTASSVASTAINGPSITHSLASKQRASQRYDGNIATYSDVATTLVDDGQGSKRRRMDITNSTSSSAVTTSSRPLTSQKSAEFHGSPDDSRDTRKLTRKRSTPSAVADTACSEYPTRSSSLGRAANLDHSDSAHSDQHSSFGPAPSRHQLPRRPQPRASSSNSADSKDDDERSLSACSRKQKRSHHHHRHATNSAGTSPHSSLSSDVTGAPSGSSRHSRK
ncbi:unnamed protein product [Dicrocoelium dendriticum]|nr:unnamed protein product [Dicrocoelium dendriticum]